MFAELDHVLGRGGVKASLRSQQHDVWMNYQTYGTAMQGASIGTVMVLNLVQAMTECTFHDQVGATWPAAEACVITSTSMADELARPLPRVTALHDRSRVANGARVQGGRHPQEGRGRGEGGADAPGAAQAQRGGCDGASRGLAAHPGPPLGGRRCGAAEDVSVRWAGEETGAGWQCSQLMGTCVGTG